VGQNVVTSHAFRLADWHINPGGSLELGVTVKKARPYASVADASNSQNGLELNIQHKQAGILGGDNMFGLQYGDGCASTLDQPPGGNPALGSGNKAWRIVDALTVERTGHYAMQATAVYQSTTDPSGARQVWTSIGGRPMVFLTRSFSLVADLGLDRIKYATDAAASAGTTGQLLKTTLAAVWRPEPKFWSVPQFRLFVTNAQWNAAAAAAGPIANNNFGTRTNGLNYGLQGELWRP
jgi:maltoporin